VSEGDDGGEKLTEETGVSGVPGRDSGSVSSVCVSSDRSRRGLFGELVTDSVVVILRDVVAVDGAILMALRDKIGGGTRPSSNDEVEVVAARDPDCGLEGVVVLVVVMLVVTISVTFCDVMTEDVDEVVAESSDCLCDDGLDVASDRLIEMLMDVAGVETEETAVDVEIVEATEAGAD